MRSQHRIGADGPIKEPPTVLELQKRAAFGSLVPALDPRRFRQLFVRWISSSHISFAHVENTEFQELLQYIAPSALVLIPQSGNTVRSWIVEEFNRCRVQLKENLKATQGQIHLSFDLWTSSNSLPMLAVVGHWTSNSATVTTTLLGLRRLQGQHSGENIAQAILEVINDFEITSRLGYFVLDNASNNDTAVLNLFAFLGQDPATAKSRRLRCLGHILNLTVKAFLFGEDAEAFEAEALAAFTLQAEINELSLWRRRGPVGCLHNIIYYIKKTAQRLEDFSKLQAESNWDNDHCLQVIADNATRWNSVYKMIERALQLRDSIGLFSLRYSDPAYTKTPLQDRLGADDWEQLKIIMVLLKPFYQLTLHLEGRAKDGNRGAIWETLPSMDLLLAHLEAAKEEYEFSEYSHISTCIKNGWAVLNKYYNRTDISPAYIAAIVLNPHYKWRYFEQKWAGFPGWISAGRTAVQGLWEREYKNLDLQLLTHELAGQEMDMDIFDEFLQLPGDDEHLGAGVDEYASYCSTKPDPRIPNIIGWWTSMANTYPQLSRMALDLLSIPAMSAECERVFSSSKLMVTDQRNRLKEDIIEAGECLRAWIKSDTI